MENKDPFEGMTLLTQGLCCMSICVPKDTKRNEIERFANINSPTGISSKWKISTDEKFSGGEPMPCVCSKDPLKMHYLLNC